MINLIKILKIYLIYNLNQNFKTLNLSFELGIYI